MFRHASDWHNNQGIGRQAEEQGMGVIPTRSLISGVFQRLMADASPEIDVLCFAPGARWEYNAGVQNDGRLLCFVMGNE